MVKNVPVPPGDRNRFAISDEDILTLARWACIIEDHYSAKKGAPTPMDIEWAKDGQTGELFIVQARPETVQSRKDADVLEVYGLKSRGRVLVRGRSVGEKIAQGPVRVINPEFAQFLVEQGIDSISLNPDTVMKTTMAILDKENLAAAAPNKPRLGTKADHD